jgi:hypothetical protein
MRLGNWAGRKALQQVIGLACNACVRAANIGPIMLGPGARRYVTTTASGEAVHGAQCTLCGPALMQVLLLVSLRSVPDDSCSAEN